MSIEYATVVKYNSPNPILNSLPYADEIYNFPQTISMTKETKDKVNKLLKIINIEIQKFFIISKKEVFLYKINSRRFEEYIQFLAAQELEKKGYKVNIYPCYCANCKRKRDNYNIMRISWRKNPEQNCCSLQ